MKTSAALFTAILIALAPVRAEKLLGTLPSPAEGEGIRIENKGGALKVYTYKLKDSKRTPKEKEEGSAKPAADSAKSASKPGANTKTQTTKSDSIFDRPLAASTAFTALDVSPETISSPSTPRDFAASVLNGVDRGGKLQTGFAVETTPFRFLMKDGINFQEYQDNAWKRLLYNAGLSIATTKASEGSKAIRLALGLNFTLWDSAEARMIKDLASAAEKVTMETGSPDITGLRTQEAIERAYEDYYRRHGDPNGRYKEARDRILKDNKYDGSKVALSWAPVWNSPDGKASRLSPDGSSVWGTGSWKFHRNGGVITEVELLTQVRYRHNERVVDASNAALSARQDTLLLAAGLRIGDENWHAQAEAAYLRTWGGLNGNNDSMRIGGGFERRISKNLWFVLQAGNDFGAGKKSEEFYTLASFRIGTDDTPFYTTQDLTKESKASR